MRNAAGSRGRAASLKVGLLLAAAALAFLTGERSAPGEARGFLRVRGASLVDGAGNPVVLRGLNVEFKDFGSVLGGEDIRAISAMGANSIRLNLDYRDFELAPRRYRPEGFARLDTALDWCERHGLFAILDLHLAPGRQNGHDFVVHRERTFHLWESAEFQERLCAGPGPPP